MTEHVAPKVDAVRQKTGGRQKGTPNRKTAETIAAVEAAGITPLDYLLLVMRDELKSSDVRLDAAKAAAPYVHPKLAAIEHSGGVTLNHETALDELE